jgi:CBS domain-containing protein
MNPSAYTVSDVMTPDVIALKENDNRALAQALFGHGRLRHLPVVRDGRLVGLVTHRDLLRCMAERGMRGAEETMASRAMMQTVVTVTSQTPLRKAARMLVHNKFGCLPVVGPGDRLVGIVTEADITRFTAMMLEELDKVTESAARIGGRRHPPARSVPPCEPPHR